MLATLLVCMLGQPVGTAEPTAFPTEPLRAVQTLRRAGHDVLVAGTDGGVVELERGAAAPRAVARYGHGTLFDARETDGALELVMTDAFDGPIVRARVGASEASWRVERPADVDFVYVMLAGDGSVYAREAIREVTRVWAGPGAEPRTLETASASMAFLDGDGRVWFANSEGALLREDGGRLVEQAPALEGLGEHDHVQYAWWSPGTDLLWHVTTTPEVVARRVDGTVVVRHPIPGEPEHISADHHEGRDVLAIMTRDDRLLVIGDGRVHARKLEGVFVDGMVLDLEDRAVYFVRRQRIERLGIVEAFEPEARRGRPAGAVRGRRPRKPPPDMCCSVRRWRGSPERCARLRR